MSHTLTKLYALHRVGRLPGDDQRWSVVQELLMAFSRDVVVRFAKGLFGSTLEHRVEDVYGQLLIKFVRCSFHPQGATIEPLLLQTARNDLNSALRNSRSPTPVYYEGAERHWEDENAHRRTMDFFAEARQRMCDFRFPEFSHAREALLAYFMTHNRHPGPSFLHTFGIHRTLRSPVYNAAVFDINRAMIAMVQAVCS